MDKIILGLLMIKHLTIYELRTMIAANFTSMCSDSMGSIQAAIKKLLEQGMIVYDEFVENSINKKVYAPTEQGVECFSRWVQTSMAAGKIKDMELSKLFFMGFVPAQKRIPLIQAHLDNLRKEKFQLEEIRRRDIDSEKQQYFKLLKGNREQLHRFSQATGRKDIGQGIEQSIEQGIEQSIEQGIEKSIEQSIEDVVEFELLTLQLGIDRVDFEIQWFENLKKREESKHGENSNYHRS